MLSVPSAAVMEEYIANDFCGRVAQTPKQRTRAAKYLYTSQVYKYILDYMTPTWYLPV